MTTPKSRTWPLAEAREVAEELITLLRPACEKIAVAGSVRRRKDQVGDIELLCISKVLSDLDFFGKSTDYAILDKMLVGIIGDGLLDYRLNRKGSRAFGPLNKLLVHRPSGIGVDIFSTTAENWGLSLLVRTGSRSFNIKVMTRFRSLGMQGHAYGGVTDQHGRDLACPTEEEVFRILQWPFVAPEQRV